MLAANAEHAISDEPAKRAAVIQSLRECRFEIIVLASREVDFMDRSLRGAPRAQDRTPA